MTDFVEEALEKIGFGKFQIITLILSGIGFGAGTAELVSLSQLKPFIQSEWSLPVSELGQMSSATFLGEIVGGVVWSFASDRIGREPVFLLTSFLMFVFSFALVFAKSYGMFCMLRGLLGFAIGGGLSVDFIYFIECVPVKNRSFRTTFIILIGIIGLMYSAVAGLCCLGRFGWRYFAAVCSLPGGLLCLGRLGWRYESPKYLLVKGHVYEAYSVLQSIAKINGKSGMKIEMESRAESLSSVSFKQAIRQYWKPTLLASGAFFSQTAAYYGLTLWMSRFLMPWKLSPSLMLLLVGAAEIPGLAVTSVALRFGVWKRGLLAGVFAGASLVSVIILFVQNKVQFVMAFCVLYSLIVSIWCALYVHIPEQFPTAYRSRLFGMAGIAGKVGGLLSPPLFAWLWTNSYLNVINIIIACLFGLGALCTLRI